MFEHAWTSCGVVGTHGRCLGGRVRRHRRQRRHPALIENLFLGHEVGAGEEDMGHAAAAVLWFQALMLTY